MNRRRSLVLLAGALMPVGVHANDRLEWTRPLMGTRFSVACHAADPEAAGRAVAEAFEEAAKINAVASDYIADAELLSLSKHPPGTPIPVSALLFRLLEEALSIAETTRGFFDPTLGPLTKLWRETRRRGRLPSPDALAAARAACGWRHLRLDPANRTVTLEKPGMRLDLGGIAKGQAADAMLAVLEKYGFASSCITAGGDVRAGAAPPGEAGWQVGIRSGANAAEEPLVIERTAVSTSGDLHQAVEIGGVRYAHIIDSATGLGLARRVSATVVAETSTLADALATACCTAPPDEAAVLAREWGARRIILRGDGV